MVETLKLIFSGETQRVRTQTGFRGTDPEQKKGKEKRHQLR